MHIPVIVMLVISGISLVGLLVIDWRISHYDENSEKEDSSEQHPHEK